MDALRATSLEYMANPASTRNAPPQFSASIGSIERALGAAGAGSSESIGLDTKPNTPAKAVPDFGRSLRDAFARNKAPQTDEQRARSAAEQFVSVTFVQPLLKQLRETSNAAPPFAPSQAEKQFQSLADQALTDRIVSASDWPLVNRLTSDLLKRRAHPSPQTTAPSQP